MKIQKAELLSRLSKVTPGIDKQGGIEQSDCFLFKNGRVGSYNDEMAVTVECPYPIEGAIKSKELLSVLSRIQEKEVTLSIEDNYLLFKRKGKKTGIVIQEVELPFINLGKKVKFKKLPSNFSDAGKVCLTSTTNSLALFHNIHVIGDLMESSDNRCVTRYKLDKEVKQELLIDIKAMQAIIKNKLDMYCKHDGWLHFKRKSEDILFSCRTYEEDDFVDLSPFFEGKKIGMFTFPKQLIDAIDMSMIFPSTDSNSKEYVDIKLKENEFIIGSRNEYGYHIESIKLKKELKKTISFSIVADLLKKILKVTDKATLHKGGMVFHTKEFQHFIPLKMEKKNAKKKASKKKK